jgi:hypothetical protein
MAAAHLPLPIAAQHFHHWLDLWDFNCRRNLATPEAAELSERAHRIGEQLQRILKGQTGLSIAAS